MSSIKSKEKSVRYQSVRLNVYKYKNESITKSKKKIHCNHKSVKYKEKVTRNQTI